MRRALWTYEKIHEGFEQFRTRHGRLPRAREIDQIEYLPSSRFIQMRFGGLEKLRTRLGYTDTHFGKGATRSQIAHRVGVRGRTAEHTLESALRTVFGEVFVHTEKFFDNSNKNRVDFYIFSPSGNFGVDVFYSDSIETLQSNVNIKMKKYHAFPGTLYLVSANQRLSQEMLDTYSTAKRTPFPENIRLVTLQTFLDAIENRTAYPDPSELKKQ